MARELIVLPDDTAAPIAAAIAGASRSLRVKMFLLSDPALLDALVAAARRGVRTRVLLNPARRSGERENGAARRRLARGGVEVKDASPSFDLTHEKSLVVDDRTAIVHSCNWTETNLTQTRDYAVMSAHDHDVSEIAACFDADWHRRRFVPRDGSHLIWCPAHGRERICRFIDAARRRLVVQNERFQDMVVIDCLIRAARRGVKVHVMARPPHTLKREKLVEGVGGLRILHDSGIKVRILKALRLHGKMLLADDVGAIVGSINFAAGSFDSRRELAIEVHDDAIVDRLRTIAHRDWKHSRPMDLSDEGLLSDLEGRIDEGPALLGLRPPRARRR